MWNNGGRIVRLDVNGADLCGMNKGGMCNEWGSCPKNVIFLLFNLVMHAKEQNFLMQIS